MIFFEFDMVCNKGKPNEFIAPGFGVYDEQCSECISRMRSIDGKIVIIPL